MDIKRVPISDLSQDPANARRHPAKNLEAIKSSLRRFGQQKPIVVDSKGIVRAGNGTLAAALDLGWKEIDVVKTPLAGSEATAYSIADNRSGELAEWDVDVLKDELTALRGDDIDLNDVGFDAEDIEKLFQEFDPNLPDENDGGGSPAKFMVIVNCENEDEQQLLFDELRDRGLKVKV